MSALPPLPPGVTVPDTVEEFHALIRGIGRVTVSEADIERLRRLTATPRRFNRPSESRSTHVDVALLDSDGRVVATTPSPLVDMPHLDSAPFEFQVVYTFTGTTPPIAYVTLMKDGVQHHDFLIATAYYQSYGRGRQFVCGESYIVTLRNAARCSRLDGARCFAVSWDKQLLMARSDY
jgi:hypothetical protein